MIFSTIPLLLSALSASAHANAPAPEFWERIDARVSHESLCQAFIDGAEYRFKRKSCTFMGCDAWEYVIRTTCGENSTGEMSTKIEYWNGGSIFSRQELSARRWAEIRGNLLRASAEASESFGQSFSLDSVEEDASGLMRVSYTVRGASGSIVSEGSWLLGDGPSIPQVLEKRLIRHGGIREEITDSLLP
jgi:hypothetical protein